MALISRIPITDVATTVTRALERVLGHDIILTTGQPGNGSPGPDLLPEGPTRSIVLPFVNGVVGEVTLVVGQRFAAAMEAAASDAELLTATLPVLEEAAATIETAVHVSASTAAAGEIATETLLTSVVGDFAAVPILENDERVASLVVRMVDDAPAPTPTPEMTPSRPPPEMASAVPAPVAIGSSSSRAPGVSGVSNAGGGMALHEFQPLAEGSAALSEPRSLTLLNDVNMEVTAELGRCRLRVRDIMALELGSVIELDRAAGSPVDVLVNGAIVWQGEVVVVDDEFGIRVSEIVMDDF